MYFNFLIDGKKFGSNENTDTKVIDILKKSGLDLENNYFIYNGKKIENFNQTLEEIASEDDKKYEEMKVLVIKKDLDVEPENLRAIIFHKEEDLFPLICSKNDKFENILSKYLKEKQLDLRSIYLLFKGNIINDTTKTFIDLESKKSIITIIVGKNNVLPEPIIPQNLEIPKKPLVNYVHGPEIIFFYNSYEAHIQCLETDIFADILKKLEKKIEIDINSAHYFYKGKEIKDTKKALKDIVKVDSKNNEIKIMVISQDIPEEPVVHYDGKVIFNYNGANTEIKCSKNDTFRDILKKLKKKNRN